MDPIYITGIASISAIGSDTSNVWEGYKTENSVFRAIELAGDQVQMGFLDSVSEKKIYALRNEHSVYRKLDRTVLLSIMASRNACRQAGWSELNDSSEANQPSIGVNIGSSRGATELFEKYYSNFQNGPNQRTSPISSPSTTLGNISSWVANDIGTDGPVLSHSVTCSTAMHSVLNGIAWLNSGMANRFIAGGSEAANTAFTYAQFKAMKIYSKNGNGVDNENDNSLACRSLDFNKINNTLILSEGAASICLEKERTASTQAQIIGVGYGNEPLIHGASLTEEGICFQKSMKMALEGAGLQNVDLDVVVMHAPGTKQGDLSELNAMKVIFGSNENDSSFPSITSNKWKVGHTLGASGGLSLEFAILMLQNNQLVESPFFKNAPKTENIKTVMVNAVGFGGNAVSIILSL